MIQILLVILFAIHGSSGSHFRGGTMSWKPIPGENKVMFSYSISFNTTSTTEKGYKEECTDDDVQNPYENVRETADKLACTDCIEGQTSQKLMFWCSKFDMDQGWAIGRNDMKYDVPPGLNEFVISFDSCCWIKDIASPDRSGKSHWNMVTEVNVKTRPDGKINSSPETGAIPTEKYYHGCTYNLRISAVDADNDLVKCEWMTEECHSDTLCGKTKGVNLKSDCSFVFNTKKAGPGNHAVNIMIKDCNNEDCQQPYSKIPLLFLMDVHGSDDKCVKPSIILPDCLTIPPNQPFEMVAQAEASDESKTITKINDLKTADGMKVSPMHSVPGYANRVGRTITWTPTSDQVGPHSVCFSAIDSDGFTSGMECTRIVVDDDPLRPDPDSSTPAPDKLINTGKTWVVMFNREIQRPSTSALIKIIDPETHDVAFSVDATNDDVTFGERSIEFLPPSGDLITSDSELINVPYTLQLDEGVAVSAAGGCGSAAAQWNIGVYNNQMVTVPPPTGGMHVRPPTFECKDDSMDIDVPSNVDQGEECFVHMPEKVTVSGGVISAPYKLCCLTTCTGSPGTRERPGTRY